MADGHTAIEGAWPAAPPQLVAVGAAAGGAEALARLLAALPPSFPAPVVVAQHLDPSRIDHLRDALIPFSRLPVHAVRDREPLEPGRIYLVPSGRQVEIADHHLILRPDDHPDAGGVPEQDQPKPSIDLLLGSAARAYGERLYTVILAGAGAGGADGARQVREAGGTVILQSPETASVPATPLSLAPTTVDIVADLEALGPLLQDMLTGAYDPPPPDQDQRMRALLEQLRNRSGIDFSHYRQPTIQRRLQRRLADTGAASFEAYVRYLHDHPDEYDRLANSFLIKVTDFFRDHDLFAYLRQQVVPDLIDHTRSARGSGDGGSPRASRRKELRLWSAGCATGEEAYSLAILLAEMLGDDVPGYDVRIFATDADASAIAFGRRGIYPASALRYLTPAQIERYFVPLDGAFEVRRFVRKLVVFGQHDLGQRAPFPQIDLALCRNVLIYFTPELQRRALQLFAFSLRTGGRLVLGKSETASPLSESFAVEQPRLKVFRRHGARVLLPPSSVRDAVPTAVGHRSIVARTDPGLTRSPQTRRQQQTPAEKAERLPIDLPVGIVVVDHHYDVQAVNAKARRLLGIHSAAIGEDFVHLASRLGSDRLRQSVDRALRGQSSVERFEVQALGTLGGEQRLLELAFHPQLAGSPGEVAARVTVVVADVTAAAAERRELAAHDARQQVELQRLTDEVRSLSRQAQPPAEASAAIQIARDILQAAQAEIERLSALVGDLDRARQELLAANAEMTGANAELRTLNEDLLLSNEAAQATVEEIETLAEEQQASNEELETLNEELQATIEELNTTNDDLEARGQELQTTALALEAERSRLAAVLASMAEAVLVVDRQGRTVLTNAAFDQVFGPGGFDFLPRDAAGHPFAPAASPQGRAARGESFSLRISWSPTRPAASGVARPGGQTLETFEVTGQPIAGTIHGGGVLVIRPVDDRPPPAAEF
jgi:two-component system CheB/CheR fusion protein